MPQSHLRPYKHDPPPELSPQHDKWVVAAEVLVLAQLDQRVRGSPLPLELWRHVYKFAEPARSKEYKRCACGRVLSITGMGNSPFAKHARRCNFAPYLSPEEDAQGVSELLPDLAQRFARACMLEAADARHAPAALTPAPAPAAPRGSSRFTGVSWHRSLGKWRAQIRVPGSQIFLGDFDVEENAARVYDAAMVKYRDGRPVNFPGEVPSGALMASLPAPPAPPAPRQSARTRRPPPPPPPPRQPTRTRGRELDEAELAALRDEWAREQLATA